MNFFVLKNIIDIYYKKHKFRFYVLFILALFAGFFEYLGLVLIYRFVLFLSNPSGEYLPKSFFYLKDSFSLSDAQKVTLVLGLAIAFIYILKNIYLFIFTKINNSTLEDLSVKIAAKIFKDILFQDYLLVKSIEKEKILNTVYKITIVVWQYCQKCIEFFANFGIILILALCLFVKFTLAAFCALCFLALFFYIEYFYLKKKSRFQNDNYSKSFDNVNTVLLKIVSNVREIRVESLEDDFLKKVIKTYKRYAFLNKDKNLNSIFHIYFGEISIMIVFGVVLCILFYTTKLNSSVLLASIATICAIILRITPSINRAQSALYLLNSNKMIAEELIEFNKKFKDNFNYTTTKLKLPFKDKIELKNISFSYENKKGINNINLEIKKGDFIGIIGKSGQYKTTLSLIIAALIKPDKGELLIDGIKIDNTNFKKWQNNISLLSQDFAFLYDDIQNKNDEFLKRLELDREKSVKELSFGQKQRAAFLNMLKSDKEVLILDEVSSCQDVISENEINKILLEIKGKKTIIAISHRLQILKHSTKAVFMDENRIIDVDTIKNLEKKYKNFKKIVEFSNIKL